MTVSSQQSSVRYQTDGSTTDFPVPFVFLANDHLVVTLGNDVSSETLALDSDYSVSGVGQASGGTVTLLHQPGGGLSLFIERQPPFTQETAYQRNDAFPERAHERALDKLTMLAQQLRLILGRAIRFPVEFPLRNPQLPHAALRARKAMIFDDDGNVAVGRDDYEDQAENAAASAAAAAQSATQADQARDIAQQIADDFGDLNAARGDWEAAVASSAASAASAAGDASRAEFAADAAVLAAGVYPSTAVMITGDANFPPVQNWHYASVPSQFGEGFLDLYQRAGDTVQYVDTYPNREAILHALQKHAELQLVVERNAADQFFDFHTYESDARYLLGHANQVVASARRDGSLNLGVNDLRNREGDLTLFNRVDFHTYATAGRSALIVSEDFRVLFPSSLITSDGDFKFPERADFFTYSTSGAGSIVISGDNKIVYPYFGGGGGEGGDANIPTDGRQNVDFNKLYLYGEGVGKRLERHPVQLIRNTPQYWRGDVTKLYALYDRLVDAYPDYVTRELIGTDAIENEIYAYEFTPPPYLVDDSPPVERPTLIIQGGIHGNEINSQMVNLVLASMLCDMPFANEIITYLRWNVNLCIVPAANPSGVNQETRYSHNFVDLNRNYDANWVSGGRTWNDGQYYTYGTEPFSEPETQAMRDYVLSKADPAMIIDTHDGSGANFYAWVGAIKPSAREIFKKASYEALVDIQQDFRPTETPQYVFQFLENGDGTFARWCAQEQGLRAGLMEVNASSAAQAAFFKNSSVVRTDVFLKLLLRIAKTSVDAYVQNLILSQWED